MASGNTFIKKNAMPDRVESLRQVDRGKNRPRTRLGFVKPIQNGVRKIKNLIKSRPSRAETGLAGKEKVELDSRKESRRDRMMRSNSFETQKVRQIGRKEARKYRGFLIFLRRCFSDGRKIMQRPGKIEYVKKIHARARKVL